MVRLFHRVLLQTRVDFVNALMAFGEQTKLLVVVPVRRTQGRR